MYDMLNLSVRVVQSTGHPNTRKKAVEFLTDYYSSIVNVEPAAVSSPDDLNIAVKILEMDDCLHDMQNCGEGELKKLVEQYLCLFYGKMKQDTQSMMDNITGQSEEE